MGNSVLHVTLPDETVAQIEALASARLGSASGTARQLIADGLARLLAQEHERVQAEQRRADEQSRLAKIATDHGLPPDADRLSIQQAVRKRELAEHDRIVNRYGGFSEKPSDLPPTPDGTHVRDGSGEPGVDASKLAPTRHETFREQSIRDKVIAK
jgi:hypothetical protein